jgi:DNA-binding CsgD family transcriptional regulator
VASFVEPQPCRIVQVDYGSGVALLWSGPGTLDWIDQRFDSLVLSAYDAALQPEGWVPFLRGINEATGSRAACMQWLSLATGKGVLVSAGLEPEVLVSYRDRFAMLDPWARVRVAPGDNVFGDEMVPRAALEATEFYADFCGPCEIRDIHKVVLSRDEQGVQISLGLLKAKRTTPRAPDRALTRRLVPHLRRSLAVASRSAAVEDARGALVEALDHDRCGVFFVDATTRVVFCNRAGQRMVDSGDGLTLSRGGLRARRPADNRALRAHLARVCGGGDVGDEEDVAPISVGRPSGRTPYRALVVPLGRRHDERVRRGLVAMVFVSDPHAEPKRTISAGTLRSLFGFTAAESRVALLVGRGMSPKEVAVHLEVSWYTVRAQLREIFAKTGVRRQSALVELLARIRSSDRDAPE